MASNQVVHHKDGDTGVWMFLAIIALVVSGTLLDIKTFGDIWHIVACSIACFPGILIIALWLIYDANETCKNKNRTPEEQEKIREEDERIYRQCRGLDPWEQEETEKQNRKDQNKRWMETQKRIIGEHHGEY